MLKDYFGILDDVCGGGANIDLSWSCASAHFPLSIDTTAFADTGYNINAVKDNQESSSTQKRMCNNTICVHLYKTRNSDNAALSRCNEMRYLFFENTN